MPSRSGGRRLDCSENGCSSSASGSDWSGSGWRGSGWSESACEWNVKGARNSSALCVSGRSFGGSKSSYELSRNGEHCEDLMTWMLGECQY